METYNCFLCSFSGFLANILKHYHESHLDVINKIIEEYDRYNLSSAQKLYPIHSQIVISLIKKHGMMKSHSEAMQVRQKPSISNIESGAGVQKGHATQYAIHHPNPELAKHEQKRKELEMTKTDYMKHLGVDSQFLRRLSRGYETRKVKPTRFNVDHPNPEYAMHEKQRQELNLTQDEYIEYLGVDDTFLRRLKNCKVEK